MLLLALVAVWSVTSMATYSAWIHGADHRDFYPWWAGARLRLLEGRDLYALDTVQVMQKMLYGQLLPPDRDQQGFAYPAQMLVLLFPFWWIPDREIATAVWEGFSLVLLCASLYLVNRLRNGKLPPLLLAGLLLWYYPLLMLFQGQITALILFGLVFGYWAFTQGKDILAGAALCLGVLKPELSLLPWLVVLGLALREKRWKVLLAFLLVQFGLLLASFAMAGWWIPGWIGAVQRYAIYAKSAWAPLTAWQISPLLALALAALLAYALLKTRWSALTGFAASIPLGILLLPQTLLWGLTTLVVPAALSWRTRGRWLVALVWLAGWLLVLAPPALWKIHSLILATLCLLAVCLSSREVTPQPAAPQVQPSPSG